VFQKFTDDPLTKCPECDASLRKVFQPVGIVFKGSGWYVNDSRKPEPDANKGAAKGDEKATDKKDSKTSNPDSTVKTPVPSDASSSAASAPAKVAAV
jgi:predicted nucleic acid-binding Zn ribbon protein